MTLAELLQEEAGKLDGFVYSSFPYPCAMQECLMHAKKYQAPPASRLSVVHKERSTEIRIKPMRGSGKRKVLTIRLWI